MTVLIAYELGIKDSNHLLSLVFINVAMQACGYLVEHSLIQPRIDATVVKGATTIGWLLLAGMWLPILGAFYYIYKDVRDNFSGITEQTGPDAGKPIKIPGFVWFIIIVQVINFSSFGLIQLGQVRSALSGAKVPYITYEKKYLWLSFVGKLGLAGGLAYGLIFRTRTCP
jgi:heme/copper-type cytochrome/quinol oxidase subunit 2